LFQPRHFGMHLGGDLFDPPLILGDALVQRFHFSEIENNPL